MYENYFNGTTYKCDRWKERGREGITQKNECMKIILKHFEKKCILITIQMVFTRRFSGGFKIT